MAAQDNAWGACPCMGMVIREPSCWWVHGTRPCMLMRLCHEGTN